MEDETRDRELAETIVRLRDSIAVPPIDPGRERLLLDAFEALRRARADRARWMWPATAAAAAAAAVTIAIGALTFSDTLRDPALPDPPAVSLGEPPPAGSEFVPWPGAHALPPFQGGELRRIELPVSALPDLGLTVPPAAIIVVEADVVVGHDGFARAVRIAQETQVQRTQR